MEQDVKVTSLVKAMKVLECFTVERPELGVSEIARILNTQKSTVHNILSTFQTMDYITKNPENNKYLLGIRLLQFSYIINSHLGIHKFLLPYMQRISDAINLVVYLGIAHDTEVLYLECIASRGNALKRNIVGEHAPMYCTALGKAMLAHLPDRIERAAQNLKKFTENTIVSREALIEDLAITRERGYAIDNMEHEFGIVCIGFPVFGHDGKVVAAFSIAGPSLRFDDNTIKLSAKTVQEIIAPAQNIM